MSTALVFWLAGAYVFLSSLANALDPADKTLFGTFHRFLLLVTNNPLVRQTVHMPLPMTQAVPLTEQEQMTALNKNK